MKIKTKLFISSIIGVLSLGSIKLYNNEMNITSYPIYYYDNYEEDNKYAKYKNGDVYIVDSMEETNKIQINNNDVIIVDDREKEDIIVIESYKINNANVRNQIIDIILNYNEEYPSKIEWIRTKDSLMNEWYVHNFLYTFRLYPTHTVDVDFENNEENQYNVKIIKRNIK